MINPIPKKTKCRTCRHAKLRRTLNPSQRARQIMAENLADETLGGQKLTKIATEFCKLKLVDLGDCDHYERKWWRRNG